MGAKTKTKSKVETTGGSVYEEYESPEAAPLLVQKAVPVDFSPTTTTPRTEGASTKGEESGGEMLRRDRAGLFAQYFAVGVLYGGLPATIYGLFLGYLNTPGYVYSTARVVVTLPWSFKFAFGMLNDCVPLFGYHRKSYMCAGWAVCATALARLANLPLPEAYWCHDGAGYTDTVCNANAATEGGRYALWLMAASCGYCVADVAADGLTVSLAKKEPSRTRGNLQTSVYLVRTLGQVVALVVVGFGLNSWRYNGSFKSGLEFPTLCGFLRCRR